MLDATNQLKRVGAKLINGDCCKRVRRGFSGICKSALLKRIPSNWSECSFALQEYAVNVVNIVKVSPWNNACVAAQQTGELVRRVGNRSDSPRVIMVVRAFLAGVHDSALARNGIVSTYYCLQFIWIQNETPWVSTFFILASCQRGVRILFNS